MQSGRPLFRHEAADTGNFLIDPETGRKVLSTRKRRGEGCHGRKALFWKAHGGGVEVLCCKVCGKTHGERRWCPRCDCLKAAEACGRCGVMGLAGVPWPGGIHDEAAADQAPDGERLVCEGSGGMCCRCAGLAAAEQREEI